MEVYNKFLKLIENKIGKESTDSEQLNIVINLEVYMLTTNL